MVFSVVVNCKPLEWNATRFQLLFDFLRLIDETFSVLFGAYFFVPFIYWHVKAEKNINSFFGWESNVEAELTPIRKRNQMILMNPLLNRKLKLNTPIPEKKPDGAWKWRRDFCDGAKLRRADLLSEESHIGLMFILYRIASQK